MNEKIIEEIKNYEFGLITLFELVTQLSTIDCKEGKIIAEQIEKVRESEQYHMHLRAFQANIERLFQDNREIDSIIGFYQVMNEED